MTVKVTVEFNTVEEAARFLGNTIERAEVVSDERAPETEQAAAATTPTKSRGRPRKTTTEPATQATPASAATQATPASAATQATPAAEPQPDAKPDVQPQVSPTVGDALPWPATFDGAKTALKEVFNAKGAGGATELLVSCGATRISEVKPADFAKFVANAAKALGK